MSKLNLEDLITNYLDTIYIISHSQGSVDSYRFAINHFKKFVQIKYEKPLEQIISEIKDDSMDRYKVFQDFVIYLDKAGKKPSSIKIWVMGAGFVKHCGIKLYNEDFKMAVKLPKRVHQREEPLTKEFILRLLNNVSPNPHLLRTIFSEKCTKANLKDKYIDAFCGRVSQGVLATNYTQLIPILSNTLQLMPSKQIPDNYHNSFHI